jgi:hypothetical protein
MKNRTVFALAICLVSSLSFADNGTDAPLVVSNPYATVQADQRANVVKRHSEKKKSNTCVPKETAQSTIKRDPPKAQESQESPAQQVISPTM